jgi:hypothetical protein
MGAIEDALNKFGEDTVKIIRDNLSATGTNASGDTSRSLQSTLIGKDRVQVTGKPFIYVVETGRKAGKMPPVSQILKWVQTGKVSFSGTATSFAWAVSRKIAEQGSSLFRKGGREDIITPAIDDQRVDDLQKEIADISLDLVVKSIKDGTRR